MFLAEQDDDAALCVQPEGAQLRKRGEASVFGSASCGGLGVIVRGVCLQGDGLEDSRRGSALPPWLKIPAWSDQGGRREAKNNVDLTGRPLSREPTRQSTAGQDPRWSPRWTAPASWRMMRQRQRHVSSTAMS